VTARGAGPYRFRVLEAVREFADEERIAGESNAAWRRHAVVMARPPRARPRSWPAAPWRRRGPLDYGERSLGSAGYAIAEDPHTALASRRTWLLVAVPRPGRCRARLRRLLTTGVPPMPTDGTGTGAARCGAACQSTVPGTMELAEVEAALAAFRRPRT
jgi:hypothetical protein